MEFLRNWFKKQREYPGFYWILGLLIFAEIAFTAEYLLLDYGILKILRYVILVCGLFVIAWIDGHEYIIPNKILLVLFATRTLFLIAECVIYREYFAVFIASSFLGFLAAGGMFLFCYLISHGAMGAGDVKLMALLGYFIGSKFIFGTIFVIVMIAAVYNVCRLILKKVSLKQEVPFAPFVLAGTLVMIGLGI